MCHRQQFVFPPLLLGTAPGGEQSALVGLWGVRPRAYARSGNTTKQEVVPENGLEAPLSPPPRSDPLLSLSVCQ